MVSLSLAKNDDRLCFWTRDELQLPRRSLQTASRIILAGKLANALSLSLSFFFSRKLMFTQTVETKPLTKEDRPGQVDSVTFERKERKERREREKGICNSVKNFELTVES